MKDRVYSGSIPGARKGQVYVFKGLKQLLGAADLSKAGDRGAGLASASESAREVARAILSDLTLEHLYDHPLTDDSGRVDEVMKANYAVDMERFSSIAATTVGELKDFLLQADGEEIRCAGRALTGVMAAALAKLMDVHELIFVAKKIERKTRARTSLGGRGVLASRLQPNHPSDDLRGLTLLTYAGLSVGSGDALIGVNPAIDTVQNVETLLRQLDKVRRQTGAPTQICVLSHIKTQLAALVKGAPVEIMFQSLAGTESTLLTEFDVSVSLLDQAFETMREKGPLRECDAEQFMYFETGQGSEFTYGKHNGIDMTTAEALCYGLARRYDPFMVNNVTGFIGPETHLDNFEMIIANLQDHFMGKLLGVPMGMAPCYTLHSKILLEGQQMATEMLTAAGANYYMDVCLNTDRMLAYFDTSGHDNQTLREIHNKRTTPEFHRWAVEQGIFEVTSAGEVVRGANWGDARRFAGSEAEFADLVKATPAYYGFQHAGPRPTNKISRTLRLNQAVSRGAIASELDPKILKGKSKKSKFVEVETEASSKDVHLGSPELGSKLSKRSLGKVKAARKTQVQVIVSDGLSAEAVHSNAPELLTVLEDGFGANKISMGKSILARYGRVKLGEKIAQKVGAELTIMLIGERPGGDTHSARSLSAYLIYQLNDKSARKAASHFSGNDDIRFEYSVISNIYEPGGLPPAEAGGVIVEKSLAILKHRAAGNRLELILKGHSNS